jgi:hypothetical protein
MDCPVCKQGMKVEDFGGLQVKVCAEGCEDIRFGYLELSKLDL